MTLPDVNIWLALALSGHSHHRAARGWIDGEEQEASLCFCRATQRALLRLLTTAEVFIPYGNPPLTNRQAWALYEQFLKDDRITFIPEPDGVDDAWKTFARRDTASPKLWMDAYLAAFATRAGLQIVTTDKAFSQFKGLRVLILKGS